MIRPLRRDEVAWAARQHGELMRGSAFAEIGTGFLECFYERFAASPHAVARVWEEDGRPAAVIAAVSDRPAFVRGLVWRHGARLTLHAARALLRPGGLRLLARLRGYPGRAGDAPIVAEMIFITVAPGIRRRGVAHDLIRAVLEEYGRRGTARVHVTIERGNDAVRRVLESLGFARVRSFAFAGKEHDLLQLGVARTAGGAP